ncbi:MAG: biotin/lipoyl-binding protein [Firmicutes bacterium]|nr:biotin/lipoyl-binding protein [Bacillota bacterium]
MQSTQKIPVSVSTAQRGSLQTQVLASGVVTAASQTAVLPLASGTVRSVDVDVGQQVYKGDPLFAVDAETASAQLQQAQAGLKAAEAQLAAAETQADVQLAQVQTALKQAQATLQQAQAAEKAAMHVSTAVTQVSGALPSGQAPGAPAQGASSPSQPPFCSAYWS